MQGKFRKNIVSYARGFVESIFLIERSKSKLEPVRFPSNRFNAFVHLFYSPFCSSVVQTELKGLWYCITPMQKVCCKKQEVKL